VLAGGNLGEPALDLLQQPAPDLYVLELSSFQLETTSNLPLVGGVVLNVTSDHMDRYDTMQQYADAKARIFDHAATAVLNIDDPLVAAMRRAGKPTITYSIERDDADFTLSSAATGRALTRSGESWLALSDLKITGLHNAANALAALALGETAGLSRAGMLEALRRFRGLPHRSQWVAEIDGVAYVNDSKGTNVGATIAAVGGSTTPLVLIAGGDGKNQDFSPLAAALRGRVREAVLIGRDAAQIEAVLDGVCRTQRAASLPEAVRLARAAARRGDTVLLSPACASLDMFKDYAHRGDTFAQAVRQMAGESA
jgi:UDP-N-acetylmuramoylalanine--D-glutamate ligase